MKEYRLEEIIEILKKRIILIILFCTIAVASAAYYSYYYLTPIYGVSTQILINETNEDGLLYSARDLDTSSNRALISTYNIIIASPLILQPVIEQLQLTRSTNALRSQISIENEGDSQVVSIKVNDRNPATAVAIANTVASVFQVEIVNIMNIDNVSILTEAELSSNPTPISPNPKLNMIIAFIASIITGVGLTFLFDFFDRTIKTKEEIEGKFGIPVLGQISLIDKKTLYKKKVINTRLSRTGSENIGSWEQES